MVEEISRDLFLAQWEGVSSPPCVQSEEQGEQAVLCSTRLKHALMHMLCFKAFTGELAQTKHRGKSSELTGKS